MVWLPFLSNSTTIIDHTILSAAMENFATPHTTIRWQSRFAPKRHRDHLEDIDRYLKRLCIKRQFDSPKSICELKRVRTKPSKRKQIPSIKNKKERCWDGKGEWCDKRFSSEIQSNSDKAPETGCRNEGDTTWLKIQKWIDQPIY